MGAVASFGSCPMAFLRPSFLLGCSQAIFVWSRLTRFAGGSVAAGRPLLDSCGVDSPEGGDEEEIPVLAEEIEVRAVDDAEVEVEVRVGCEKGTSAEEATCARDLFAPVGAAGGVTISTSSSVKSICVNGGKVA